MKFYILLLFVLPFINLFAQENNRNNIEIEFNSGFMHIDFQSLKKLNDEVVSSITIPVIITDNFAPRLSYGMNLSLNIKTKSNREYGIGLVYNFYSTGSRIAYSDYSGEYHGDNIYTLVQYGISILPIIKYNEKGFSMKPFIQGGLLNTTLHSTDYQRLYKSDTTITSSYSKTSYYGEIGTKLNYSFANYFIGVKFSYLKEFDKIMFTNGNYLTASAFRYGLYAGVRL